MKIIPSPVAYALRIAHIALWMSIPATSWLWLGAEAPAECVPKYGWYQGNVLCIDEDSFLFIAISLFLVGLFTIYCWIGGYSWQLIGRAIRGDKALPPVKLSVFSTGLRLFGASLRCWLPAIGLAIFGFAFLSGFPREVSDPGFESLVVVSALVALVMYWGNLVGLARFAAFGEISRVWHRRENIRLALTNIGATLLLSFLMILVTALGVTVWEQLANLLYFSRNLDLLVEAALGSFAFFFLLICWTIVCSHLIARYSIRIGICDHLKLGATLG